MNEGQMSRKKEVFSNICLVIVSYCLRSSSKPFTRSVQIFELLACWWNSEQTFSFVKLKHTSSCPKPFQYYTVNFGYNQIDIFYSTTLPARVHHTSQVYFRCMHRRNFILLRQKCASFALVKLNLQSDTNNADMIKPMKQVSY